MLPKTLNSVLVGALGIKRIVLVSHPYGKQCSMYAFVWTALIVFEANTPYPT